MKTLKVATVSLFLLPFASAFAAETLAPGKYAIDADHSKIGFGIKHLVISTVEGRFSGVTGDVVLGKKVEDTKFSGVVKVETIDTGVAKRDAHLKSPEFFDAAKFPTITFKSKKVTGATDKLAIVGDLTIHGVTKEVTLDGVYNGSVKDPWGNERIAIEATGKINRKDFGLAWSQVVEKGPVVADDVALKISVEAIRAKN